MQAAMFAARLAPEVSPASASGRARRLVAVTTLVPLLCVANASLAENWETLGRHGIATIAVDADSVVAVEGRPETREAWFRFRYDVMLDCSPPRGCLASSQKVHYRLTCSGPLAGTIAPLQRILLDLAGNVLAQSEIVAGAISYWPPTGTVESEMVGSFCRDPRFSGFVRSGPPPAWSPAVPAPTRPPPAD